MPSTVLALLSAVVMTLALAGCGGGEGVAAAPEPQQSAARGAPQAATIEITAREYGFGVSPTLSGGLVDMALDNDGSELHYAAFARPVEGKTLADVRAALTTPPGSGSPGPLPMVEYAALGTVAPGRTSRMTVNLPAGPYVLFCAFPAPDGTPHNVLGMMVDVDVTGGTAGSLPDTLAAVLAFDFAYGILPNPNPKLKAGTNRIKLDNRGRQAHEIDLVEVADGKTIDDAIAWAATLLGPPPINFLGGAAVGAGLSAVGTFELKPGVRYAFVCVVPDTLGDFAPHLTKGMYSAIFEVSSA